MYTKEESSKLKQQFWAKFGQYMRPVPGAGGSHINWVNYKTGKRHIAFKMDADKEQATVAIEIQHSDAAERENCFQQFLSLKTLLENETGFEWQWQKETLKGNGETISIIIQVLLSVNVLNEKDWPAIIAFLKPRIIALDSFWELVKDGFD